MAKSPIPEVKKKPDEPGVFQPYVPDKTDLPEFTWSAVVMGTLLGLVFGASSLYLVLRVGLTVSASIPVAVLSITLFRAFSKAFGMRRTSILENNIVQTAGSAGESIAFGVGVTMPAIMLLGFDLSITRVMVVALLGGVLGILMMIPLRRAFIVKLHGKADEPGKLLYPEGTACAEVLKSGEAGGTAGSTVFIGFGLAFVHKFLTEGMYLLKQTVVWPVSAINRSANFAGEMASELLGVGYIIGARTSAIMMAGAVLGYLVIAPIISLFGDAAVSPVAPSREMLIRDMSLKNLRENYLLFIGAGCVAAAGIISMIKTMPMIIRSIRSGLGGLGGGSDETRLANRRTDDDLSFRVVVIGCLMLLGLLMAFLLPEVGWRGALAGSTLVLVFGFLFVTVSSRLTGEIGSSSNPISGMTVATLLMTCVIFLAMGMTSPAERVLALSIGGVVCIAASNGGTTSQDLKTGFLVGATPKKQQWAILIGTLTSALVIGGTLVLFNSAGTLYSEKNLPQLNLIKRDFTSLPITTYKTKSYRVWRPTDAELPDVRAETYLVEMSGDEGTIPGKVAYMVDPAITGRLKERDDGSHRSFVFEAPKTQVMSLIINGMLKQNLRWDLVLIGAMIAVTLELCGVSSLAFAVGLYVPINFSTPIFIGGLVRWGVDLWTARKNGGQAEDEVKTIADTESSPGILLASGYIAGGSLAGVALAFLAFSDTLPERLAQWQYPTTQLSAAQAIDQAYIELAQQELGFAKRPSETRPSAEEIARIKVTATEIKELNAPYLPEFIVVRKGMRLQIPDRTDPWVAQSDGLLGEFASGVVGGVKPAAEIYMINQTQLSLPTTYPANATLRLPQRNWPAYLAFIGLTGALLAVGTGWVFGGTKTKTTENHPSR